MFKIVLVPLITIFITYSNNIFCQNINDSLLIELQISKDNIHKIQILKKLCYENIDNNVEDALNYGKKGLKIAYEIKHLKNIAELSAMIGMCYNNLADTTNAIKYYNVALYIYQVMGEKNEYAYVCNNLGLLYINMGSYLKALQNIKKAFLIYYETANKKGVADSYKNIGFIYAKRQEFVKALEFYKKALNIYITINDNKNIALLFDNIGLIYLKLGENIKAFEYFNEAIKISVNNNFKFELGKTYIDLGEFYKTTNDYNKALSYFQKAFILFKEINNKKFLFHSINCIIELYLIKNNYNEALLQSKQAYELLNGIKDLELQLRFYNNMSLIYEKLDNYEKSLYFHKLYADVKDSLLSWEHKQKLIEMEAKYQSKKREKEIINKNVKISLLKKDQEIEAYKLWGLILLIIVGVTFVIALNKRIITAKQLYEQKIKNNETQKLLVEAELTNQRLKNLQLQQKLDFKQKELDYKNNQLIKFASYITQKNDFLKKLKSKLLSLNNNFDINELKELLDAYTRSLDKDRQEFETNIKEISQTFLLRIRELVPNLTKNEERMLVLLRLNLSSKEIATILKTTLRSVEMARHRLRKKFNLGPDENLNEFLKKI